MAQQNRDTKPTNRVFIFLLVGCVLASILGFQIWENLETSKTLKETLTQVNIQREQATVLKLELQAQVDLLNDDQYVLKLARSRGYFSLPNEIIFTLPEDNSILKQEKAREINQEQKSTSEE